VYNKCSTIITGEIKLIMLNYRCELNALSNNAVSFFLCLFCLYFFHATSAHTWPSNAVVTREIKLFHNCFSLRRRPIEIILFRCLETCLRLFQNYFTVLYCS